MHEAGKIDGYEIVPLSANNIHALDILFKRVHRRGNTRGHYHKKYENGGFGFFAFAKDSTPVAFYGIIPCLLTDGKQIVRSAQCVDAMTHPLHRHKGLFSLLSQKCIEKCQADDLRFVFGFPNQMSAPVFLNELGWNELGNLKRFTIPVGNSFWSRICRRFRNEKLLDDFEPASGCMTSSVLKDGFTGVLRDSNFMKARLNPGARLLQLGNALIWLKAGDTFQIGDMEISDEDFDNAMDNVIQLAKRLFASAIHFQSSPGTNLYQTFNKRLQSFDSFPVIYKDFGSGLDIERVKFTFADIDIF